MLQGAVFLSIVALAFGSPLFGDDNVSDFPPRPGCHYNVTAQANFKVPNAGVQWYFDSVTASKPLTGVTCFNWKGKFTNMNNVGSLQFVQHIVAGGQKVDVKCAGKDYADAPADFNLGCTITHHSAPITVQFRIVDTDFKTYALATFCEGKASGPFDEAMGIIGPRKRGVDPAVRKRLIKRLVAAGWNPNMIQRIPSQNGC